MLDGHARSNTMFYKRKIKFTPNEPHTLYDLNFDEKSEVEWMLKSLEEVADDPYLVSTILIASAELGDRHMYEQSLGKLFNMIDYLSKNESFDPDNGIQLDPDKFTEDMRGSSFMAWMWAQVGVAAKSMDDKPTLATARKKLNEILLAEIQPTDLIRSTFAWGCLAALDRTDYLRSIAIAEGFAKDLVHQHKEDPSPKNLSKAIWALVINLSAAASFNDFSRYEQIKSTIASLEDNESVVATLINGIPTEIGSSNNCGWALAKVQLAAAMMHDEMLYHEVGSPSTLDAVLQTAQVSGQIGEYVLGVLENKLAEIEQGELQERSHFSSKL